MFQLKMWARTMALAAAISTAFAPFGSVMMPAQVYAAEKLELVEQSPITSGATLNRYIWQFERKGQPVSVNVDAIIVDLHNPYVKLDTIMGTNNQYTKKQNIQKMAQEAGAVAAINGDFFNTKAEGVPIGPQIRDGKLEATPPYLIGFQSFALTKDNEPIIDLFTFEGAVTAEDGTSYPLGGINKTYYWYEDDGVHTPGQHAMIDGLYMYTHSWGQVYRSIDGVTTPTEVLVQNGVIKQIELEGIINQIAPEDGYILRASGKAHEFVRDHLKVGQKIKVNYRMFAKDPTKTYDPSTFKTMIGGHTILVEDGKPSGYSRSISDISGYAGVARTAVGFSKDKRYVYLITAEKSERSQGLTIPELQNFMVNIGVWRGMNLDGGGSTQMVSRPLGGTQVQYVNQTTNGEKRPVVNGLAIWSLAPKGAPKSISIAGRSDLLIGQSYAYSLTGYDEYFNTLSAADLAPLGKWTVTGNGVINGNTVTATAPGTITLKATAGTASAQHQIRVLGGQDIHSLEITGNMPELKVGATYPLPAVVALTSDGQERAVPAAGLRWEFAGFDAEVNDDRLTIKSMDGDQPAYLIAHYDRFSTSQLLTSGETVVFADFESNTDIVKKVTPADVKGEVSRVQSGNGHSLKLQYDFTGGDKVTKALYAQFGPEGQKITGNPSGMTLKVKGDNSHNWIRAEFKDAAGQVKWVDITRDTNWSDWKTVHVPLNLSNMQQPLKLNRIYVVNPANGQETRALTGAVEIDDVWLHYPPKADQTRNEVELVIDKPTLKVNGNTLRLDQAPVIDRGNTLVPLRFVVEAMGGQVIWNDTAAGRSVQVLLGSNYAHMWLGSERMALNGKAVTAEVPPQLMNERTMVPLRVLAESMGWTVEWDGETRTVTLK
ncbi:stalk domain-containing protein [Paenibacillus thermoaerophilus]|uniref:Stalk domain-containing protein n=1 Tax=Paenibacillus thermoaerophilus TaxID=1215385 RepID=A0ABW2V7H4_9BACL|nr:stalk domain-containing protein [Paenibacillus thermoaerophilus]TMV12513.1 copper amine oxidase [Paenibacillus thermoaerophilus]